MSDFTFVNLVLAKATIVVKEYIQPHAYLVDINETWSGILTKNDDRFNSMNDKDFSEQIMSLSEKTPILFFAHPEDHGFGFVILHQRQKVSSLYIDYEFEDNLAMNIAKRIHGNIGLDLWMKDSTEFDRLAIQEKDREIENLFSNIHLNNFQLFGFSNNHVSELSNVCTPEKFKDCKYQMVEDFMRILDMEEVNFMAWRYANGREKNFNIIKKG